MTMTEYEFMGRIIDLATINRWTVNHQRPGRTTDGYRTAIIGHPGFPDLVLARNRIILFREVKTDTGKLTAAQLHWGQQLGDTWAVYRPSMWDRIVAELSVKPGHLSARPGPGNPSEAGGFDA